MPYQRCRLVHIVVFYPQAAENEAGTFLRNAQFKVIWKTNQYPNCFKNTEKSIEL